MNRLFFNFKDLVVLTTEWLLWLQTSWRDMQWLWEIRSWYLKLIAQGNPCNSQLPSSSYNHNTLTTLRTSLKESLQMHFEVVNKYRKHSDKLLHKAIQVAAAQIILQPCTIQYGALVSWHSCKRFLERATVCIFDVRVFYPNASSNSCITVQHRSSVYTGGTNKPRSGNMDLLYWCTNILIYTAKTKWLF